jgi:DNA anti-recombination protein RmuC
MPNPLLEEIIEDELEKAVEVKDKEALKRYVKILVSSFSESNEVTKLNQEIKESINILTKETSGVREEIKLLIETMNRRFEEQKEYTDKRFEDLIHYSDKRFEEIIAYTDKTFKEQKEYTDKRFEDLIHYSDKRFEELMHYSDKRFEDMNKKFNLLTWMIGIGFTVVSVLIVIFRFLR